MKVFLGIHELGYERVRLYLREGTGANGETLPVDKGLPVIEIGADRERFSQIVASLLHESQEMAMMRMGHSYSHYQSLNSSTADFMFILNHEQFNECCTRAADLITTAMPVLKIAWEKYKKKAKT